MDDAKLSKLHDDFRKASDSRGKHGGLGKSSKASSKRIQIEYVEKPEFPSADSTEAKAPSGPDPKQPFIRFVRATQQDKMGVTKDKNEAVEVSVDKVSKSDKVKNGESNGSSKTEEKKKSSKKLKRDLIRCSKVIEVGSREDVIQSIKDSVSDLEDVRVESAWGLLKKATLKTAEEDANTYKRARITHLIGSLEDLEAKILYTNEDIEVEDAIVEATGTLTKATADKSGVQVLVTFSKAQ